MQRIFLLFIIALISALSALVSKLLLQDLPEGIVVFIRYLLAFLFLIPFYQVLKGKNIREFLRLIILSSGMGLGTIFFTYGIKTTNLGAAQAIYISLPVITLILSHYLIHEKIVSRKIYGVIVSLIGASIIVLLPKIYGSGFNVGTLKGNLLIFLAAVSLTLYTIYSRKSGFTSLEFMFGGIIGGTLTTSVIAIPDVFRYDTIFAELKWIHLGYFIFLSLVCTVVFYFLVQHLIKISSPFFSSFASYIQLIFSSLLGYFFFSEYIGLGFFIGSILTMYGVYYVSRVK